MIRMYGRNGPSLSQIKSKRLEREDDLQRWIAEDPEIIGLETLVIGREVNTGFGRIDVLGLDQLGNLIVIECKRDRTPREVIAQLLDYGSWIASLNTSDIRRIANERLDAPLARAFQGRFESVLPEALNTSHSLVVVASEFDASSRRIVEYLANVHHLSINAVFFSIFEHAGEDLFAIEWFRDQEDVSERAEDKTSAPWTGLTYVNVGEGDHRTWEDMRKYGFVSAGGRLTFIEDLQRLTPGDTILAYQKQAGYVGLGTVVEPAVPMNEFHVNALPILDQALNARDFGHDADDLSRCEHIARVKWIKTYSISEAKTFPGVFANQHVVCKLRQPATLAFLADHFPILKRES